MGFTEADLSNGGSDAFIDAMVLWGTADQVKQGLRAHFAAGATHVAIQPVHAEGDAAARDRDHAGAGGYLRETAATVRAGARQAGRFG